MPDIEKTSNEEATPAVAGVLQITPLLSGHSALRIGPSAGWLTPRGIQQWEREVCLVARADMTPAFARALRATLPVEQIAPKKYPLTHRAAEASPLVEIAPNLAAEARAQGVRVHNVGVDRVSSGFFYLADGGVGEAVDAHANLIEMLLPSMGASASNSEIAAVLETVVDRLLAALSKGVLAELDVELADALPRLARDGTGLAGIDLDAFEASARALAERSVRWEDGARRSVPLLVEAERQGRDVAPIPLYGEATRVRLPPLDILVSGRPLRLPALHRWTVQGAPRAEIGAAIRPTSAGAPVAVAAASVPAPAATATATPVLPLVVEASAPAKSSVTPPTPATPTESVASQPPTPSHPIVVIGPAAPEAATTAAPVVPDAPAVPEQAPVVAIGPAPDVAHALSGIEAQGPTAAPPEEPSQHPDERSPEASPAAPPRNIVVSDGTKRAPLPQAALTPPQPQKTSRSPTSMMWFVIAALAAAVWRWLHLHHG